MTILICIPACQSSVGDWTEWAAGPAYVSAALKSAGHRVINVNFMLEERGVRETLSDIMSDNEIDAIAAGDLVSHWERVKEIIDAAKSIAPHVVAIIGGGLVTHSPIEAMKIIPSADYGVVGEGEITVCELVKSLERRVDVSSVPGIVFRDEEEGGLPIITQLRRDISDLDSLPFPDYDGFQFGKLLMNGCASIVTSRSCPFSCTYCTHSGGKSFRMRSLDSVFEEIDWLVQKYNIKRLTLSDELFTIKPERLAEFCERITPYNLKWRISLRISDNLTLNLFQKMRNSGCAIILFGLESADDRILKSMRKGITVAQIERCLSLSKEAGMDVTGNFIFGDPAETMRTVYSTLKWVNMHRDLLMHINLGVVSVYPGSRLYEDAVKSGKIRDTLEHIRGGCKPFNCSSMTNDEYQYVIGELLPKETERLLQAKTHLSFSPMPVTDEYAIEWVCPNCGRDCNAKIKSGYIYKSRPYEIICQHCEHTATTILALEYCRHIKHAFNKIIVDNKKNKTILWGTGWFLRCVFMQITELKAYSPENAPFVLCDIEPGKQGIPVFGHKVYTPENALRKNDVNICIVTNMFYEEIKKTITRNHPQIKVVAVHDIGNIPEFN